MKRKERQRKTNKFTLLYFKKEKQNETKNNKRMYINYIILYRDLIDKHEQDTENG